MQRYKGSVIVLYVHFYTFMFTKSESQNVIVHCTQMFRNDKNDLLLIC